MSEQGDRQADRLRRDVTTQIMRLAPIVAANGVRLAELRAEELRDLEMCLRHIEQRLESAERKARRAGTLWR